MTISSLKSSLSGISCRIQEILGKSEELTMFEQNLCKKGTSQNIQTNRQIYLRRKLIRNLTLTEYLDLSMQISIFFRFQYGVSMPISTWYK